MLIIGIDPGPEKSAAVILQDGKVTRAEYALNNAILMDMAIDIIPQKRFGVKLALEYPEGRGMAVAQSVLDTCYWCGRFDIDGTAARYHPRNIRAHFCGTAASKRANVRQAVDDRYGPVGTVKKHGPLWLIAGYGVHKNETSDDSESVTSHIWDALAVALMYYELHANEKEAGRETD